MSKGEEITNMTSSDSKKLSNDYPSSNSHQTSSNLNIQRKDAKGNPILRRKINGIKTRFHAYFADEIKKGELEEVIKIKSYKDYNRDEPINEDEEEEENEQGIGVSVDNPIGQGNCQRCCMIF